MKNALNNLPSHILAYFGFLGMDMRIYYFFSNFYLFVNLFIFIVIKKHNNTILTIFKYTVQ